MGRKSGVGRLLTLAYLATVGTVVVGVFAILALIWLIGDMVSVLIRGEQLETGRGALATPLYHHIGLMKYGIFGDTFPGYNPWNPSGSNL